MSGKSVIGIDFGPSVVKMVEYSPKKGEVLTIAKLFIEPLGLNNDSDIFKKIIEWVQEKKQSAQAELVVGLPAEKSVIQFLEMPEGPQGAQKNVEWELEQYLSEPLENYVYDMDFQDQTRVLVAAFKKELAINYKSGFDTKALPLSILDVDLFATVNAFEANYPEQTDPILLLKADVHCLTLLHLDKKRWGKIELIPIPKSYLDLETGSEKSDLINSLMESVTQFTEKISEPKPVQCFYCGDLTSDMEFIEALKSTSTLDCKALNAFKKITFPHDPEHQQKVEETAPQCATALGLALRFQGDSLDPR